MIFHPIFILLSIMIFSTLSFGQTVDEYGRWKNGVAEPWSFDYERYSQDTAIKAQNRWEQIKAELDGTNENEWAGDYSWGQDVYLSILRWTPTGGYVRFGVYTCLPEVRSIDYGTVKATPSYILLSSEASDKNTRSKRIKYLPVKWGDRHYLITENQVEIFWSYVAGYGPETDESGSAEGFLERVGDQNKPIEGLPVFPPGYERFVRKPVDATITAVGTSYVRNDPEDEWWDDLIVPVTLNVGRAEGVKDDMFFNVLGFEDRETVDVTRVGKHTSKGVIVRHIRKKPGVKIGEWDDGKDLVYREIEAGLKLSTSEHK